MWAIHVFAHEIARVPLLVGDPALGQIRLAWWRDRLDMLHRGQVPTDHPLMAPLGRSIARATPSKPAFDAQIEARSEQLASPVVPDEAVFERFALATGGMPASLAASAARFDERATSLFRQIGTIDARIALWAGSRQHALALVPRDHLRRHGIEPPTRTVDAAAWARCRTDAANDLDRGLRSIDPAPLPPLARLLHGIAARRLRRLKAGDPLSPAFRHRPRLGGLRLAWDAMFTVS